IVRKMMESLHAYQEPADGEKARETELAMLKEDASDYEVATVIGELERDMQDAALNLEFERAAALRDEIYKLKQRGKSPADSQAGSKTGDAAPVKSAGRPSPGPAKRGRRGGGR